jgi:uncharacterized protein (DUF4415 family)
MSAKTTGVIKFKLNSKKPVVLSKRASARLSRLQDRDIDLSDIPETSGVSWTRPYSKKREVRLRIDEDVLEFFKSGGPRYQARINDVLRKFVDSVR